MKEADYGIMTMNNPDLFTIGHSNFPIGKFIGLLGIHHIKTVYDIRSLPFSRCPQFHKENLSRALQESGIGYMFDGDRLGGRIDDPECYKDKMIPERKINIAELVDYRVLIKREWFRQGIEDLMNIAKESRTAILCSEENPSRCHRYLLVGRRLLELGIAVYHIRGDGLLETATMETSPYIVQQKLF